MHADKLKAFGLLLMAALALCAGCDRGFGAKQSAPPVERATEKFFAGPALWDDPQNTPHPMFGWPTLSSPPANKTLPSYWTPTPARALPSPIVGLQHVAQAEIESGAGIAVYGSLVVVPGFGPASHIVDISDPAAPQVLSQFNVNSGNAKHGAAGTHRGAAIIAYPTGRLVTVISTDTHIDVWDITEPTRPRRLPSLNPIQGGHKVGVVPGTPIVYNAASAGGGTPQGNLGMGTGVTEIFDLTDPDHPVHVQDFANGYSCHHVYFWNRPEQNKYRAICAGVEYTQIWDTTDPRNPRVIVSVPFHHGVVGAPSAAVIPVPSATTPAGNVSTPVGAVWFYDVTDETNPLFRGYYSAANDLLVKKDALSSCPHITAGWCRTPTGAIYWR